MVSRAATVTVISQDEQGLRFRVSADDLVVHPDTGSGALRTRLSSSDALFLVNPDSSAVLIQPIELGIPAGAAVYLRELSRTVEPLDAPPPALPSAASALTPAAADPRPGARLADEGWMRQQRIQRLTLTLAGWQDGQWSRLVNADYELAFRTSPVTTTHGPAVAESGDFNTILESRLLNAEQARRWQARETAPAPLLSTHPAFQGDRVYKIAVQHDGIHKVTAADLQAAGVPLGEIQTSRLALWAGDEQIPVLVSDGNDGHMDGGDYLLFHGVERVGENFPKSFFGPQNHYFLSWDQGTSRRYLHDATGPGDLEPVDRFVQQRNYEENRIWGLLKDVVDPPEEVDHWFWRELSTIGAPGLISFPLAVPYPVADSLALNRIRYTCRGRTVENLTAPAISSPDHHLIFRINSQFAGELQYRYAEEAASADWPLPGTLLTHGNNTLSVELPLDHGNTYDLNYLNRIHLNYLREIRLDSGHLSVPITAEAFPDPAFVRVLKVRGVTGQLLAFSEDRFIAGLRPDPSEAGSWLVPVPVGAGVIHLAEERSLLAPDAVLGTENQDLRATGNRADMLIVAHNQYLGDLASLVEYHQQFRTVKLVDVEAIYDEFGDGNPSTESLHAFLAYAFDHWQAPLPSYMLLVGKASNANMQDVGGGQIYHTQVPTDWVWTAPYGATATDEEFTYIVGGPNDPFQDLMVGRISVATRSQLQAYLEKHRQYREREVKGNWMETSLFCADNDDPDFEWGNDYVTRFQVPADHRIKQIHVRSNSIYHGGAVEFIDQFNSGSIVNSYNGHGNVGIYATEALFRATDIRFLTNRGKYPICYAWSCLVGYYDDPDSMSMAELLVKQPNAGAIAFYGAAAKAYISVDNPMVLNYYSRFYDPRVRTFGQGVLLTEMTMKAVNGGPNLTQMYNLLGDPALEPAMPRGQLEVSEPWYTANSGQTLELQVTGEPAGMSGTLRAELWLNGRRGVNAGSAAAVAQASYNNGATLSLTVPATIPADSSYRAVIRLSMDTASDRAIGQVPVFINSSVPTLTQHNPAQGIAGMPMTWTLETLPGAQEVRLLANVNLNTGLQPTSGLYNAPMANQGNGLWTFTLSQLPFSLDGYFAPQNYPAYRTGMVYYSFTVTDSTGTRPIPGGLIPVSTREELRSFSDSLFITGSGDSLGVIHRFSINSLAEPATAVISLEETAAGILVARDTLAVSAGANTWSRGLAIDPGARSLRLTVGALRYDSGALAGMAPLQVVDDFLLVTPGAGTGGVIPLDGRRFALSAAPGTLADVIQIDSSLVALPLAATGPAMINAGLAPLVADSSWEGAVRLTPRLLPPAVLADTRPVRLSCLLDSSSTFLGQDGVPVSAADSPRLALARWNESRELWVVQESSRIEGPGGPALSAPLHPEGGVHLPFRIEDGDGPSIAVDVNGQWFAEGDRVPRAPVFQILVGDPAGVDIGDGSQPPRIFLDGNEVESTELQLNDNRTSVLINWTPGELEASSAHTLRVEAADVLGNASSRELAFTVASRLAVTFFANHPNPFADQTVFAWELTDAPRSLVFEIYTSAGRKVRTIPVSFPRIGYDEYTWDGRDDKGRELANGLYYLRLKAADAAGTVEATYKLARLQ